MLNFKIKFDILFVKEDMSYATTKYTKAGKYKT